MKKTALLLIISFYLQSVRGKEITDMAGRKVTVPEVITRILPYDSRTSILLFPCASEKMVARAMLPGQKNYSFIDAKYIKMSEVDVKNMEEILSVMPEVIIAGIYSKEEQFDPFEQLQKRLKIPVILVDMSIDKLDDTYTFLGKLIGAEQVCKKLSDYLSSIYTQINVLTKSKPVSGISAYYTIGPTGLMTDPSGSKHTEVLDIMKITNAAKIDLPSGGHAKVNMEQVLVWNPDYIFAAGFKGGNNAYNSIKTSQLWSGIKAVKNNRVYKIPNQPFGWFDHPPSINRIPGLIWLCEIFYEQDPKITKTKITDFYKLFYHFQLSEQNYVQLIKAE